MQLQVDQPAVEGAGHIVQFYERDDELLDSVVPFLLRGIAADEVVVTIATGAHRQAILERLDAAGLDRDSVRIGTDLLLLDAERTLAQILVDGVPDGDRFERVVGNVLREAAAHSRPVRAYGEMVALLWNDGLVGAAIDLERLWNGLGAELDFALYCAYGVDPGADLVDLAAIESVCALHTAVVDTPPLPLEAVDPAPSLEAWRSFSADMQAPSKARRFVTDVLDRWNVEELAGDAALVVTELATNAVAHARSAFTVSVRTVAGDVAITVHDRSRSLPRRRVGPIDAPSGRGLHLVSTIAAAWGVRPLPEGKIVWAELRR